MSELLELANRLIEARDNAPCSPWTNTPYIIAAGDGKSIFHNDSRMDASSEFIVMAGNHVVDIISGYQELLRHVLILCNGNDPACNQDIAERWDWLIGEIEASLPQENTNE